LKLKEEIPADPVRKEEEELNKTRFNAFNNRVLMECGELHNNG
jgi:hypothetical protein